MIAKVIAFGPGPRSRPRNAPAPPRSHGGVRRREQPAAAAGHRHAPGIRCSGRRHGLRRSRARRADRGYAACAGIAASLRRALRSRERCPPAGGNPSPWTPGRWLARGVARRPSRSDSARRDSSDGAQRMRGEEIELERWRIDLRGRVQKTGAGRFAVDAGRGVRELELIRDREHLQVVGRTDRRRSRWHRPGHSSAASRMRMHIRPRPCPGRVVEMRVKAGDVVERGDCARNSRRHEDAARDPRRARRAHRERARAHGRAGRGRGRPV